MQVLFFFSVPARIAAAEAAEAIALAEVAEVTARAMIIAAGVPKDAMASKGPFLK